MPEAVGVQLIWLLVLGLPEVPMDVLLAKYCTLCTEPSLSRALAVICIWRLNAATVVEGEIVIEGAMLEAATTLTLLVPEAATLPSLSFASATTSALPGGTPMNEALSRHVLASWSRTAWPMLLRLRKNSTEMTEPSESVAVATRFTFEVVVVEPGTLMLIDGARPMRLFTTTRREAVLVPTAVPTVACVVTV